MLGLLQLNVLLPLLPKIGLEYSQGRLSYSDQAAKLWWDELPWVKLAFSLTIRTASHPPRILSRVDLEFIDWLEKSDPAGK
jgi:hypothetical protein